MSFPLVSVCIPAYNRYDIVKDALSSVFMQSYKNIEVILCDDCSNEPLEEYIYPYLQKIKYIKHTTNKGVSASRNTCINNSNGEYIAFLDSDDLWLPDKIEKQIDYMIKNNLSISHTNEFWYKNGKWLNQSKKHSRYGGYIFDKVLDMCRVSPSSLVIKKGVGYFDESLRVCEDYEFILRMSLLYEIGYIDEKLLIKRSITKDQLSSNIKFIESVRYNILKNFAKDSHNLKDEYKKALDIELQRKKEITKDR